MGIVLLEYRSISWGGPNEDDNNNVWALEDENSDPGSVQLEDLGVVGDPVENFPAQANYNGMAFAFWNATDGVNALPGFPNADPQRRLNIPKLPANSVVHATAWYAPPGGGGEGKPGIRARTFDIDLNGFRKETPIQSATPANAWAGPNNHSVYTDAAAASVTPKSKLLYPAPLATQPPGEPAKEFKHWQAIVGPLMIANGVASCAKGKSALGLAFYGHGKGQRFDLGLHEAMFDWWAEFWGKRGAEGEGPFGPGGPGDPWGPFVARLVATVPPAQWKARLEREMAALKKVIANLEQKAR